MTNHLIIEIQGKSRLLFCSHIVNIQKCSPRTKVDDKYKIAALTVNDSWEILGIYSTQKQMDDVYQKLKNFLWSTRCECYGHLFEMPADEGQFYHNSEWE